MAKISQKKTEIIDKRKIEFKNKKKQLAEIETKYIQKKYKDNLKAEIENRLNEMVTKLKETEEQLTIPEIKNLLTLKLNIGTNYTYTVTELKILLDYYKQFIIEINKNLQSTYVPTKIDFCNFIGISTLTYNAWRQSDDASRRDIMQMIDDYILDLQLSLAQTGEAKEITTIFRSKAEHGLVEAQAPIVMLHKKEVDLDDIMEKVNVVNQGKSLQAIELKKNKNGIYEEE